jgi:protein TonB
MLPVSIAVHAIGAIACFIIPLAAEEPPPVPAPLSRALNIMTARPVPPAPAPAPMRSTPTAARNPDAAPLVAATSITPERPAEPARTGEPAAPGGIGVDDGVAGGINIGSVVAAAPPPPPPPIIRQPVRPGGDIREPQKMFHVPPVYPQIALSAGVHGVVILEATISETGTIENLRVLRSHPLLERAAVEAVKQWRYTPTRLNGVPVPIIMTVTVNFMIQR